MAINDFEGATLLTGRWRYDSVWKTAEIVAFDCDYFFERMSYCDDRLEWIRYPLGADGLLYYAKVDGDILPLKPFPTIEATRNWLDAQRWGPIEWKA